MPFQSTSLYYEGSFANIAIFPTVPRVFTSLTTSILSPPPANHPGISALDNFGVDYIELTSPAASEQSYEDCKAICQLGLKVRAPRLSCVT